MIFFNFDDFYSKPLIPIGENDSLSLPTEPSTLSSQNITHWLIGLVGNEKSKDSPIYQWRVVVYPSDALGCVDYQLPYFISPFPYSFNEAIEYCKQLIGMASEDQLFSINKQREN
jgi:hypothetical protein